MVTIGLCEEDEIYLVIITSGCLGHFCCYCCSVKLERCYGQFQPKLGRKNCSGSGYRGDLARINWVCPDPETVSYGDMVVVSEDLFFSRNVTGSRMMFGISLHLRESHCLLRTLLTIFSINTINSNTLASRMRF